MGHPSRVPTPSPFQILAICQARAEGLSAHEIHRRTGHSNMSALRWFDRYGHEAAVLHDWRRRYNIDMSGFTFDDFYPKYVIDDPRGLAPGWSNQHRVIFQTKDGPKK